MKKTVLACLIACLLLIPALAPAQGPINMVGEWRGVCHIFAEDRGYVMNKEVTYIIQEQRGQIFHGIKKWKKDEQNFAETLAGSVGHEGALYMVEGKDGVAFGRMLAEDVLEIHYLEPGRVTVSKLTKLH